MRGLLDSPFRDIRLTAARTLGAISRGSKSGAPVVGDLIRRLTIVTEGEEFRYLVRAAAEAAGDLTVWSDWLAHELLRRFKEGLATKGLHAADTVEVLRAAQGVDVIVEQRLVDRLHDAIGDYRLDTVVRRETAAARSSLCRLDGRLVDSVIELLRSPPDRLAEAPIRAAAVLVRRCRRRLEHVRSIFPRLEPLRDELLIQHAQITRIERSRAFVPRLSEIREIVEDVQSILNGYREVTQNERLAETLA